MTSRNDSTTITDIVEIAKCFRSDLAAAIKSGKIPKGVKCKVQSQRYSGGQSLHVSIVAVPDTLAVSNHEARDAWLAIDGNNAWSSFCPGRYTAEAQAVFDVIVDYANRHNWDNSDSQSDHFDVNFYLHVKYNLPV